MHNQSGIWLQRQRRIELFRDTDGVSAEDRLSLACGATVDTYATGGNGALRREQPGT